jgi:hypothetical protein
MMGSNGSGNKLWCPGRLLQPVEWMGQGQLLCPSLIAAVWPGYHNLLTIQYGNVKCFARQLG